MVLNKADGVLQSGEQASTGCTHGMPGVDIVAVSAFGELTALDPHLSPGRTVAFVGPSGVGKSSLINALLGESATHRAVRGRRTAGPPHRRQRANCVLDRGAIVIDTPGQLQPWVMRRRSWTFDDIAALESVSDGASAQTRLRRASRDCERRALQARLEHHDRLARELAYNRASAMSMRHSREAPVEEHPSRAEVADSRRDSGARCPDERVIERRDGSC